MSIPIQRRRNAGFTLIELLVAIGISVVLLSILAFVFRIATASTRDANSRVAITERMRSLNIRIRQEIGGMLPILRLDGAGKPFLDKRTFDLAPDFWSLTFSTATTENGRPVSVDVRYRFIENIADRDKSVLIREVDKTGPYEIDIATGLKTKLNALYKLGDDQFEGPWGQREVMVANVRKVKFTVLDVPAGMPGGPPAASSATDLSPRELPSGVRLEIEFGPEVGNPDMLENAALVFPVYRGL